MLVELTIFCISDSEIYREDRAYESLTSILGRLMTGGRWRDCIDLKTMFSNEGMDARISLIDHFCFAPVFGLSTKEISG